MSTDELKKKIHTEVARYSHRHYVRRVALFGSAASGAEKEGSDIDLLVSFDPVAPVGFFEFVRFQQYLERRLGRTIDLVTEQGLSPYIRERVLGSAQLIYGV